MRCQNLISGLFLSFLLSVCAEALVSNETTSPNPTEDSQIKMLIDDMNHIKNRLNALEKLAKSTTEIVAELELITKGTPEKKGTTDKVTALEESLNSTTENVYLLNQALVGLTNSLGSIGGQHNLIPVSSAKTFPLNFINSSELIKIGLNNKFDSLTRDLMNLQNEINMLKPLLLNLPPKR